MLTRRTFDPTCVYRNLNPHIMAVKPAEDRVRGVFPDRLESKKPRERINLGLLCAENLMMALRPSRNYAGSPSNPPRRVIQTGS